MGPVLARVGDRVSQTGQPLQRVHGLEVPAQEGIHARAIQDGLVAVEIHELLEGARRADHVAGQILDGLARTRPAATPRGGSPRGGTGGTRAPAGGARRVRKPPRPAWAGGRGTGRRGREREAASAADEVPGVRAPRQSAPTPPGRARRPATPRASPRPPPAPAPACRRRRSCTRSAGRAPPARRSAVLRGARNRRLSRTRRKPMWVRRERSCHSPYAGPRQVRFSGCFSAELVRRAPAPW